MKLIFVSVYLNIHQLPFCMELKKKLDSDFSYISTDPITEDRVQMGFEDMDRQYDFVIRSYSSPEQMEKARSLIQTADVAIMGSCPDELLNLRLKTGKLTFKYSERFFKGGNSLKERVRYFLSAFRHIRPLERENIYFLCASAYTAADVNRYYNFHGRCFRWGYFRETIFVDESKLAQSKVRNFIIWVGRFCHWKHPESVIQIANRFRKSGMNVHIEMVGDGETRDEILKLIKMNNLENMITLPGALPPEVVQEKMRKAGIALFTSDYKEGWGVVINEAMNAGCAVVASEAMGAVPFLMKDRVNGLQFPYNDVDKSYELIKELMEKPDFAEYLGCQAYKTITEEWSVQNAVNRLFQLIDTIQKNGNPADLFKSGPCSLAPSEIQ